jgi:hypothetical protein
MLKCIDAYYYHHDAHSGVRARGCGWRLREAARRPDDVRRGLGLAPKKGRCLWRYI